VAPSVQRRKVWLTPTTRVPCSNAAKTRNPLKFAGVPQTRQQISAVSRPKFTILSGHVEKVLMFKNFFPIVDTCLSSEDIARQSCAMVPKWQFLRPVFPPSRVQHISDLHSKFARATPCVEVWWTSNLRPLRLGEEKDKRRRKKKDGNHRAKYNGRPYYIGRPMAITSSYESMHSLTAPSSLCA